MSEHAHKDVSGTGIKLQNAPTGSTSSYAKSTQTGK